jgi:multiple sugar transport system substrate-binding protein
MPLVLTSKRSSLTIHYIASWIWDAGGDFLSPDGINLAFTMPKAMDGCKAYFHLGRYLGDGARNLDEEESNKAFRSGNAAVTLNGYWMLDNNEMELDVRNNLGVVSMPGSPFVGGQDLVVWNHSRHKPAAIKLIEFLHSDIAGKGLYPLYGLPVSESAWENPPFDTGFYPIFKAAIRQGRGFQGQLWGLVEKRLTDEYADIWADVMKSPESQMASIVESHLNNLANRLQLSISS